MKRIRLLPSSLIGRVFLLYTVALLLFVTISFVAFSRFQYHSTLEEAQDSANMMIEVVAQTVSDSAVIGDYDTIQRTLNKAIAGSRFASAKAHPEVSARQLQGKCFELTHTTTIALLTAAARGGRLFIRIRQCFCPALGQQHAGFGFVLQQQFECG